MGQHYDVIVIGGGHNGLVNAAYLAKAGKKVVVLERRHVLGGAAVTEEIIPGFLFSECSYVVSLLRPEIIRELDLPRHGLEILPLDGTFSPMPSGDYLWRVNDHAKSIRDIRRHSRLDAEAYDEFSKMMTPMCRLVKHGRAAGVILQSGEELFANVVSSSVDPHLTFEKFLEPSELPADFLEGVRRYKFRGSSGKVNLALDALPNFKCFPGPGAHQRGAISISPSMEYMERAYDDAKYGHFSRKPYIDMVIPSLTDPSVAPPGKHVLSCFVQYAPYKLAEGTWDDQKEAFGDNVINTIVEYAPNIKDIIIGRQVLTPLDLEREFGLTQGNIFQGELSLEQLFFLRPVAGWAYYRTPIHNLYMCGSATHPGGGIMGANGRIASQVILKEWSHALRARRTKSGSSDSAATASKAAN